MRDPLQNRPITSLRQSKSARVLTTPGPLMPTAEPVLLGEAGGVRLYFSWTSTPWDLAGLEVLVIPVGPTGLSGELAQSYLAATPLPAGEELLAAESTIGEVSPATPKFVRLSTSSASPPGLILVSAYPVKGDVATLEGVSLAATAMLSLAAKENIHVLAVPLIGAGGGGLGDNRVEVARRIIKAAILFAGRATFDVYIYDRYEFSGDDLNSLRDGVRGDARVVHLAWNASEAEGALKAPHYSAALATLFSRAGSDFSFGLFGPWGRGKTYLMDRVATQLTNSHNYEVVKFSAWAYPQTPVLWAYLYKCVAEQALAGGWRTHVARTLRAGLARRGVGDLFLGLILFGIGALSLGIKFELVQLIYGFVGLAGFFTLARVAYQGSLLGRRLREYMALPGHDEHLGLQAVIGSDLRTLLEGWMPHKSPISCGMAALYFLLCGGVAAALFPWRSPWGSTTSWLGVGLVTLWLGASITLGYLALYYRKAPKRVLLVVDDLDRCEPSRMLEVIENLRLFIETQAVGERMQVAMLVDEKALALALATKYRDYGRGQDISAQLLEESVEKLFLVYLRLPPLMAEDLDELAEKYFAAIRGVRSPIAPSLGSPSGALAVTKATGGTSTPPTGGGDQKAPTPDTLTFSADEEIALRQEIRMLAKHRAGRVGPRTVRSIMFRYQLARLLLDAIGEDIGTAALAAALVRAHVASARDGDNGRARQIVDQVCLPTDVATP